MAEPLPPHPVRGGSRVLVGDSASLAQALLSGLPADDARAVVDRLDGSGTGDHRRRRLRSPLRDTGPSGTYSSEQLDELAAEPWRGQ